jgi:hypothetical protein
MMAVAKISGSSGRCEKRSGRAFFVSTFSGHDIETADAVLGHEWLAAPTSWLILIKFEFCAKSYDVFGCVVGNVT